jgi:hypothetical protein
MAYDANPPAVYYRLAAGPNQSQWPGLAGLVLDGSVKTAPAPDANGLIQITLYANSEYEFWAGRAGRVSLLTGTTSPVLIPQILSDQTAAI